MVTETRSERMRIRLRRLRDVLAESARDEEHEALWSGQARIDRLQALSVAQRDRLLRRGFLRGRHGTP